MDNVRAILGERLARGEIAEEEYDRLIAKVTSTSTVGGQDTASDISGGQAAPPPQQQKFAPAALIQRWWKWGAAGLVIFMGLTIYSQIVGNRVHVLNLRTSGFLGDNVTGALFTEGESGEVYLWVEQGNQMMCPKKTFIASRQERRFQFSCGSIKTSGGNIRVITLRNPSDWVKKNATSL